MRKSEFMSEEPLNNYAVHPTYQPSHPPVGDSSFLLLYSIRNLNLNRQNWDSVFNCKKKQKIATLSSRGCACVLYLAEGQQQPPLQPSYQPSQQPQSHLIELSPAAMRQERMLARQPAASILSPNPSHLSLLVCPRLSLCLSSSCLPRSRLACTVCGSWVDECGGMERDWNSPTITE